MSEQAAWKYYFVSFYTGEGHGRSWLKYDANSHFVAVEVEAALKLTYRTCTITSFVQVDEGTYLANQAAEERHANRTD